MKHPLPIKFNYLDWGAWEGVRELMQNGIDSERQFGAKLEVSYNKGVLVIENEGTVLPRSALLLGHTTKAHAEGMAGKFGEGLKLGCLALVRLGMGVKIRTGEETWVPSIGPHKTFGNENVLIFDIKGGLTFKNVVRIEVTGLSPEQWEDFKKNFVFLVPSDQKVETAYGNILLDEGQKGRVFVKGIFVMSDEKLSYGYDISDATVDRDRKMMDGYELEYRTRYIWADAANRGIKVDDLADMLEAGSKEATFESYNAAGLNLEAREQVHAKFVQKHGDDAIPCLNYDEVQKVSHIGKKGVIVQKSHAAVLQTITGSPSSVVEKLQTEIAETFEKDALTPEQLGYLMRAIEMVGEVEPLTPEHVDVVRFRSNQRIGEYKNGRVSIARSCLYSLDSCLRVLVHEVAHKHGYDGSGQHVDAIERIFGKIVTNLVAKHSVERRTIEV